jgi:ribose transport system permease protein
MTATQTTEPVTPTPEPAARRHSPIGDLAERYGLLVMFAVMIAAFGLQGTTGSIFLSHANLIQIAGSQMVVILVAFAVMLPLNMGYFDLSAGAAAGVSSVACASAMSRFGLPVVVAVIASLLVGTLIGLVNGILIARFRLSPVITTLAMSTALTGLMQWYTAGSTISSGIPGSLLNFGSLNWLGVPQLAYLVVPVALVLWYLQECRPFGRNQRAIRSSGKAARLVGINVDRTVLVSFVAAGFIAGIAGALMVARAGGADSTTGRATCSRPWPRSSSARQRSSRAVLTRSARSSASSLSRSP